MGSAASTGLRAPLKFCGALFLGLLFAFPSVVAADKTKHPEPSAIEQKDAEKEVQKLFPLPAKDPAARKRHAMKLLVAAVGKELSDRPSQQFIVLRQARDIAYGVGDLETTLRAVVALAQHFQGDARGWMVDAIVTASRSETALSGKIVRACVDFVTSIRTHADFENGKRLAAIVGGFARKTDSAWLRGNLEGCTETLRGLEGWQGVVVAANSKVASNPEDPGANEILGKFLCLVADQWEQGLPFLSRSGDPRLVDLAKAELLSRETLDRQSELARSWWDRSVEEKDGTLQSAMQMRAGKWFTAALPHLSGAEKALAEAHLAKLPQRFLSDLEEFDVHVAVGWLGKTGDLGHRAPEGESRIVVNGLAARRGLGAHPPPQGASRVCYELNRAYKKLRVWVALNDSARAPRGTVTFVVKGDGKVLWRSSPIKKKEQSQLCTASVEGVVTIELSAECPGSNHYAHAVWLDPVVSR